MHYGVEATAGQRPGDPPFLAPHVALLAREIAVKRFVGAEENVEEWHQRPGGGDIAALLVVVRNADVVADRVCSLRRRHPHIFYHHLIGGGFWQELQDLPAKLDGFKRSHHRTQERIAGGLVLKVEFSQDRHERIIIALQFPAKGRVRPAHGGGLHHLAQEGRAPNISPRPIHRGPPRLRA